MNTPQSNSANTKGKVLIIEENSMVPVDRRVWYEATTLRDAGWSVSVICPAGKGAHAGEGLSDVSNDPEVLEGIFIYRFPLKFAEEGVVDYLQEYLTAFLSITRLTGRVWRERGFQILHICNPPDIFFLLGLFYRLKGVKFVFDLHDLLPEMVAWRFNGVTGKFAYLMSRLMEYLTLKCANKVIVTNLSYLHVIQKRGNLPAKKITIVRNGPMISEFVPTDPCPELKKGYKYMVCFVGIMGEEDGVGELLRVIQHIVLDLGRDDILFTLIGDGSKRKQAMTEMMNFGFDPYVDLPGFIKDSDLIRQYISTADVCVSPEPLTFLNNLSTFIKVGEYMAIGKPVVAFDLKETRITAEESACYAPPGDINAFGDAIIQLLENPGLRAKMGAIGRQRVQDLLGWEHQQKNLIYAYQQALSLDFTT